MVTPNTVYAREVAQLFVSGRHNQFKASSRFGSLEGSRMLSSRLLQGTTPTPSLPSSESIVGRQQHQRRNWSKIASEAMLAELNWYTDRKALIRTQETEKMVETGNCKPPGLVVPAVRA